jgi:predicted SAM-dependent methyltransferase
MASETSLCRERLKKFCAGCGLDIGYGGDPILPSAITVDMPSPYTTVGDAPLNLAGDARDLRWFRDGTLDYVFSSHLLEDFKPDETRHVLLEWLRVIRTGGHLVIYCPDERVYSEHCRKTGQEYNKSHSIPDFGLEYLKGIVGGMEGVRVVHEAPHVDIYSFELVLMKTGTTEGSSMTARMKARILLGNLKAAVKRMIKTCPR